MPVISHAVQHLSIAGTPSGSGTRLTIVVQGWRSSSALPQTNGSISSASRRFMLENRTLIAVRAKMNECLKLGSGEGCSIVRVWVQRPAGRQA